MSKKRKTALAIVMGLLFLLQISDVVLARFCLSSEAYANMDEIMHCISEQYERYQEFPSFFFAKLFSGIYPGDIFWNFLFSGAGANAVFLAVFAGIYLWKTKKKQGLPFFALETALALFFLCYEFGHDSIFILFSLAALCAAAGFFLCRSPGEPMPPFLLAAVAPAFLMLVFRLISCYSKVWFAFFLVLLTDVASFYLWKKRTKDLLPFLLCEGNLFFSLMLYSRTATPQTKLRLAVYWLQFGCGASWISLVFYGLLASSVLFFFWREWGFWKNKTNVK